MTDLPTGKPYGVAIESFCEKHYIKDLQKKHKEVPWRETLKGVKGMVRNPNASLASKKLTVIHDLGAVKICKGEFKIFGSKVSVKRSGLRFIMAVDGERLMSRVLLVYGKDHVRGGHETVWWQGVVRDNFPQYKI